MSHAAPHSPNDTFDQWLVLRAQAGDEQALLQLHTRWAKRLHRHAMRLTNNADGAADATQESWLAIVRGLDRLNDPACFRRWAYQIVGRKCADWIRRRQRNRALTEPLTDAAEPSEDTEPITERSDAVQQALNRMSNQDRVLLAMHYTDELPLREIAEAQQLPLGTVKSRLYHARQRLKEVLERNERISNPRGEEHER